MDTPAAPDNRAPDSADSNDKDPGYFIPVDNLKEQLVEKISGEKENSTWLILNEKYILHKNRIFKNGNIVWECKNRRALACPFKCETTDLGDIELLWMYCETTHTCSQDPMVIYQHRFKVEVKEKMKADYRATFAVVYNTTKRAFLELWGYVGKWPKNTFLKYLRIFF